MIVVQQPPFTLLLVPGTITAVCFAVSGLPIAIAARHPTAECHWIVRANEYTGEGSGDRAGMVEAFLGVSALR